MQTARNGDTVVIDYVVRTDDGSVVGSTEQEGPQTVSIGGGQIFPQIEGALEGMAVGADQTVTVPAADAFGARRDELVIEIPRSNLPPEAEPQPGMTLSARQQDGQTVNLLITEVGESAVTADGNHPLAGQDLHFGLKLVEIRQAA
jgi:FKBP-type peptidyl-prolyl cis-trans isomerase 2